jgi:hypothetical protein
MIIKTWYKYSDSRSFIPLGLGEKLIRWPGAAFERKPVAVNSEGDTKFISFDYGVRGGQNLPSHPSLIASSKPSLIASLSP